MNDNINLQLHKNLQKEHDKFYADKGNLVVADIEFTLKTHTDKQNKHGKEIAVSFPIKIDETTLYNISKINQDAFKKFYKRHKDVNGDISPLSHYHSEAFLFYYLNSNKGRRQIADSLQNIKGVLPKNTAEIISTKIYLHTTLSMCSSCQKLSRGQDNSDKKSFIESFQEQISNNLIDNGFNLNNNFYIMLSPSYRNKHSNKKTIVHVDTDSLKSLDSKKSPIDFLNKDGEFDFKKPTHALFTSGGSVDIDNKSYDNLIQYTKKGSINQRVKIGKIQTYENSDFVVKLEELANKKADVIIKNCVKNPTGYKLRNLIGRKIEAKREIIEAFNELPRGF